MSKTKQKTSSTTASTSNSTTTPTVAPWLSQGYQDFGNQISKFAQTDPTAYVAGPSSTQSQAFTGAQNLGEWQGGLTNATNMATNAAGQSVAPVSATQTRGMDMTDYMNPYTDNVVNTTLADYDVNSGRTRASQAASAAQGHAFGGSRYAIREGETEGELARGRATADATLRDQAYQSAVARAEADANRSQQASLFNAGLQGDGLNRQLQASGLLGNFANSQATNARGDVATQLAAGDIEHSIDQAQAQALPDWLKNISGLYGSIPVGSFTSLNQTGANTGQANGSSTTTSASVGFNPLTGFSFGG